MSNNQGSDAKMKRNGFSIESPSKNVKCSIRILIEEIKPAGSEVYEFLYRRKATLLGLFLTPDDFGPGLSRI